MCLKLKINTKVIPEQDLDGMIGEMAIISDFAPCNEEGQQLSIPLKKADYFWIFIRHSAAQAGMVNKIKHLSDLYFLYDCKKEKPAYLIGKPIIGLYKEKDFRTTLRGLIPFRISK